MNYQPKNVAAAGRDVSVKTAALFYRHVFPLSPKKSAEDLPDILNLYKLSPEFEPPELRGVEIPPVYGVYRWRVYQCSLLIRDLSVNSDLATAEGGPSIGDPMRANE